MTTIFERFSPKLIWFSGRKRRDVTDFWSELHDDIILTPDQQKFFGLNQNVSERLSETSFLKSQSDETHKARRTEP